MAHAGAHVSSEARVIIAFDLGINGNSVHLLVAMAAVMDEHISGQDDIRFAQNY